MSPQPALTFLDKVLMGTNNCHCLDKLLGEQLGFRRLSALHLHLVLSPLTCRTQAFGLASDITLSICKVG